LQREERNGGEAAEVGVGIEDVADLSGRKVGEGRRRAWATGGAQQPRRSRREQRRGAAGRLARAWMTKRAGSPGTSERAGKRSVALNGWFAAVRGTP
jgi:hypothetical protein